MALNLPASCVSFLSPAITGVHYHAWLTILLSFPFGSINIA
jgi:hypothetical protein